MQRWMGVGSPVQRKCFLYARDIRLEGVVVRALWTIVSPSRARFLGWKSSRKTGIRSAGDKDAIRIRWGGGRNKGPVFPERKHTRQCRSRIRLVGKVNVA